MSTSKRLFDELNDDDYVLTTNSDDEIDVVHLSPSASNSSAYEFQHVSKKHRSEETPDMQSVVETLLSETMYKRTKPTRITYTCAFSKYVLEFPFEHTLKKEHIELLMPATRENTRLMVSKMRVLTYVNRCPLIIPLCVSNCTPSIFTASQNKQSYKLINFTHQLSPTSNVMPYEESCIEQNFKVPFLPDMSPIKLEFLRPFPYDEYKKQSIANTAHCFQLTVELEYIEIYSD